MQYASLSADKVIGLKKKATKARAAILKSTTLAKSGHPGGSMSSIDILLTIYEMMNINKDNYQSEGRDRILVSHGHISPAVYSALSLNGFFDIDEFVSQFRLAGSIYEGHIERSVPGVEWGTGNLGQGLSAGCGFALASKIKKVPYNVVVLMGDGEQQKGQLSEARRFAVKYGLSNLIGIIDYNQLQIGGSIKKVMPQNIKEEYQADGWDVFEIDGHSFEEIGKTLIKALKSDKPALILANTVMGKGVSFMENKEGYHGAAISEEQLVTALEELGCENDFERYKKLRKEAKLTAEHTVENMPLPNLNTGDPIVYDKPLDNRSAWGNALADIAKINSKEPYSPLVVLDCDLQGSVKTADFEKQVPENFIQCGIMEHHTISMGGTLSVEGLQTFFAGFGVFGVDETYNQHRLNDINKANLKLVVTHVGLDVGEDGKTHQCLDYLGLMRNIYGFKSIIPVCPNQTDRATRYIANKEGGYLLAMGRSKVSIITKEDGTPYYDENYKYEYGKADLIREGTDGALLVMGSVGAKGLEVVEKLREKGIKLQLWAVSAPNAMDKEFLSKVASTGKIFTYEDHNVNTGLGSLVAEKLVEYELQSKLVKFGVADYALSGNAEEVYKYAGLSVEQVMEKIEKL